MLTRTSQPPPQVTMDDKVKAAISAMTEAFARAIKSYSQGCPVPYATSAAANLSAADSSQDSVVFMPVCGFSDAARSNPTDRIGSNFSPYVSLFRSDATVSEWHVVPPEVAGMSLLGTTFLPLAPFCQKHFSFPRAFPVECFLFRDEVWHDGVVLAFDPRTLTYEVVVDGVTTLHVTRQVLRLRDESIGHFHEVLDIARAERAMHETTLRRRLFLSLVEEDVARPMPTDVINRILRWATRRHRRAEDVRQLTAEMRAEYAAALAEGRLRYFLLNPRNRQSVQALSIMDRGAESVFADASSAAGLGFATIGSRNIKDCVVDRTARQAAAQVLTGSLRWSSPTLECLCSIRSAWLDKYAHLVCVKLPTVRTARDVVLEYKEFVRSNVAATDAAARLLRVQYTSEVDCIMVEQLKGKFSYSHLTEQSFRSSPLGHFFGVVRIDMSRNVRAVLDTSLAMLSDFFDQSPCGKTGAPRFAPVLSDDYYDIKGERCVDRSPLVLQLHLTSYDARVLPPAATIRDELTAFVEHMIRTMGSLECLENIVMTGITLPKAFIPCGGTGTPEALAAINAVTAAIDSAAPLLSTVAQAFSKFLPVAELRAEDELFPPDDLKDTALLVKELNRIREIREKIRWTAPDTLHCRAFCVNIADAKQQLDKAWSARYDRLIDITEQRIFDTAVKANDAFRGIHATLAQRPTCAEEMQALMSYSVDALKTLSAIERKDCRYVQAWVRVLESVLHSVSPDVTAVVLEMFHWPATLDAHFSTSDGMVKRERQHMIDELEAFAASVREKINNASVIVDELYFVCEIERIDATAETIQSVRATLEAVTKEIATLHRRQDIFEQARSSFDALPSIVNNFEAIEQFWFAIRDSTAGLQRYFDMPVSMLTPESMIEDAENWRRLLRAATRSLRGFPETYNIGRKTEAHIARFQEVLPTLELLKGPGMRPTHWKEISKKMGREGRENGELHPSDATLTLQRLLEMDLQDHHAAIAAISTNAAKEYAIEVRFEQMKAEARQMRLGFADVGDGSTLRVLENVHEIAPIIDHQLAATQQMRSSAHVAAQLSTAVDWEALLVRFQDTLNLWLRVQEQWLQLHPVMVQSSYATSLGDGSGDDAGSVAPIAVVQTYAQADAAYRSIVDEVDRTQHSIISVMSLESLPHRLADVQTALQSVRADVLSLMDAKRRIFPRFYFVSDSQMLSCLSSADLSALAPLFQQMYCCLSHLELTKHDLIGFIAVDGTRLLCDTPVALTNEPIESFMQRLDRALRVAMASNLDLSNKEYIKTPLRTWLFKWGGQFIDVVLRARFTKDVEEVIEATGGRGLESYRRKVQRVMAEFVTMNRSRTTMKSSEVAILTNAVVQDLQNRDILSAMIRERVSSIPEVHAFPSFRTYVNDDRTCTVSLHHVSSPYSYEYLGATAAPIMTPEFLGLSRSVALSAAVGGHSLLTGPTGVGKSEIVRGLGVLYGRFVWSFQCIGEASLQSFHTILRGSITVGAWLVFEDMHLLSQSAAYELGIVANAVAAAKRSNAPIRLNEGTEATYSLHPDFALVGTTTLPWRDFQSHVHPMLASQFRPVHMMQPSFDTVAAVMMAACGMEAHVPRWGPKLCQFFSTGRSYAPSVFTFGRLNAVIRSASAFEDRAHLELGLALAIDKLLVRALSSVDVDVAVDHLRTLELAPPEGSPTRRSDPLDAPLASFDHLLLLGPSFSGKTTAARRIAKLMNTEAIELAPRALSAAVLWGHYETRSSELTWVRGIVDTVVWECSKPGSHLIQFDGLPRAADEQVWLPIFDQQRRAVSTGGTSQVVSRQTRVVFKTITMNDATPRISSRCGIVHYDHPIDWQVLLRRQLVENMPTAIVTQLENLVGLAAIVAPRLVEGCDKAPAERQAGTLHCRVFVTATIFGRIAGGLVADSVELHPQAPMQALLFALAWGFCGGMTAKERKDAEDHMMAEASDAALSFARDIDSSIDLFPNGSVFGQMVTPSGWRPMPRRGTDAAGAPDDSEVTLDGLFLAPETVANLSILRFFMSRGVGVLALGSNDSGLTKATKAAVASLGSNTVSISFSCSRDSTTTALLQQVDKRLHRRKGKSVGPPAGKQLVLFVDDVHLPVSRGHDRTALIHAAFVQLRGLIMSPTYGVVPLVDTTVVATSKADMAVHDQYRRAFVTLLLQPLSPESLRSFLTAAALHAVKDTQHMAPIAREAIAFVCDAHRLCVVGEEPTTTRWTTPLLLRSTRVALELIQGRTVEALLPKSIVSETRRIFSTATSLDPTQLCRVLDTCAIRHFAAISQEMTDAMISNASVESFASLAPLSDDVGGVTELVPPRQAEQKFVEIVDRFNENHIRKVVVATAPTAINASTERAAAQTGPHVTGRMFPTRHLLHHAAVLTSHLNDGPNHCCLSGDPASSMPPLLVAALATNSTVLLVTESCEQDAFTYSDWCREMRSAVKIAARPNEAILVIVPAIALDIGANGQDSCSVLGDIDTMVRSKTLPSEIAHEEDITSIEGSSVQLMWQQLRFVLMVSSDDQCETLCSAFPSLRAMCRFRVVDAEHNHVELTEIGTLILASDGGLEDQAEPLAEIAATIFERVRQASTGTLTRRDFVNFATLITELHRGREPEVRRMLDQNTLLAKTIASLQDEEGKCGQQRKDLLPQYSQLNDEILEEERKAAALADDLERAKTDFKSLENNTVTIVSSLEAKKHAIKQLNDAMTVQLADARNGILECDGKHIVNLRLSISPPVKVKHLMEGICLLLGERPDKNVRGSLTPDFWTLARRLMEEPDFVERLITVDAMSPFLPANADALAEYVDTCENNRFTSFSPFAQAVSEWFLAIVTAMKYKAESDTLAAEVQGGQEDMLQMVEGLESRRDHLSTGTKRLNALRASLDRLRAARNKVNEDLQVCESRLHSASRVVSMVSALSEQYHREYLLAREHEANLIGDVYLTSITLTCLMALEGSVREQALAAVEVILSDHELTTTKDFNIRKVLTPDCQLLRHEIRGIDLPRHLTDTVTALSTRSFPNWPLFVTRLALIADVIEDQLRYSFSNVIVVSMHAKNASDSLLAALRTGCVCVVKDPFGQLPPGWKAVVDIAPRLRRRTEPMEMTFLRQTVEVKPTFQLVFISQRPLSNEVSDSFTVIHCDSEDGVRREAWAQLLLANRPAGDSDNLYTAEMKDLHRLEARRLTSRDTVSKLIRTHAGSIIDRINLIEQLEEQITSLLRATTSGGNSGDRARSFDERRRRPIQLLARACDTIYESFTVLDAAFSAFFALNVTVFSDLVSRAYTLNKSVNSTVARERLQGLTPREEQQLVGGFVVQSALDMFIPAFPSCSRQMVGAWLALSLADDDLFSPKRAPWYAPDHAQRVKAALLAFNAVHTGNGAAVDTTSSEQGNWRSMCRPVRSCPRGARRR
jgi:hypothetical protein